MSATNKAPAASLHERAAEAAEPSFLLECFRDFYAEVLRHKSHVTEHLSKPDASGLGAEIPTEAESHRNARVIQRDLLAIINEQAQAILSRGDDKEQRRFSELKYVMVALADETFLYLDWEGKELWEDYLLEEQLFGTHHAGQLFFVRLDELLQHRDPTCADVMAAFLLALLLGFRGQYVGPEDEGRLRQYRQQLFLALFQRNPGLTDANTLFPQAYAYTVSNRPQEWLPQVRGYLFALLGVALLYLAISHYLWSREANHLQDIITQLRQAPRSGSAAANRSGSR